MPDDPQRQSSLAAVSEPTPLPPLSPIATPTEGNTVEQANRSESSSEAAPSQIDEARINLGRYVILDKINTGGMGVVYRALDSALGRTVALKTIRGGPDVRDELVERFHQEALEVARLKHPGVVQVYDFGEFGGHHFFTMALADGGSLSKHLKFYQADARVAVALLEKVARAVQYIHENGLLHRDLKPGNILLDRGEPLVSDFGLAKSLQADLELTRTGHALGTPAYMAPEQAAGRGDLVSPRTDVWALGVILYELVCGQRPFRGQSREDMTRAIQEDEPSAPRSVQPKLDRHLEAILLKCLEKEPARRYRSAGALADDLGSWLRGEPIRAKPLGPIGRLIRAGRKHPVRLAGLLLLLTLPLIVAFLSDRLDDDRELKRVESELAKGLAVTLIGENSDPRWCRFPVRGEPVRAAKNQAFAVKSSSVALCELLRSPQWKSFRFRAEVRHELTNIMGDCGIYVAHDVHRRGERDFHGFITARFADFGQHVDNGIGNYGYRVFVQHQPAVGPMTRLMLQNRPGTKFPAAEVEREPRWRRLAIEATPSEVRLGWEGDIVLKVPMDKVEALGPASQEWGPMLGAPAPFSLAGGLGLYVNSGVASFRNVVIEPLTQGE